MTITEQIDGTLAMLCTLCLLYPEADLQAAAERARQDIVRDVTEAFKLNRCATCGSDVSVTTRTVCAECDKPLYPWPTTVAECEHDIQRLSFEIADLQQRRNQLCSAICVPREG